MKGLTNKQRNILDFIGDFISDMGMAPTVYEIAGHFGIKTSTVFAHVRALQKKGFLSRSSKARSISLLKERRRQRKALGIHAIRIIGDENAEMPHPAVQEVFCDSDFLGAEDVSNPKELFALRVNGQESRDLGILDGDIAIVRKQANPLRDGSIVVTCENGKYSLLGCHADHKGSIEVSMRSGSGILKKYPVKDLALQGVVVGVQRMM